MKNFFWTTIFWIAVAAGFIGYLRWFNQPLAQDISQLIVTNQVSSVVTSLGIQDIPLNSGTMLSGALSGEIEAVTTTIAMPVETPNNTLDTKLEEIKAQLKDINEKLDIQNSNTPDAVSVSLRTTKKTNVWVFPLDGTDYKKYVMPASDDILRDTLNLLFDKTAFALADSKLDNDGNLTLVLQRVPGSSFGGAAAVEQTRLSIEKTALQFPQIKKVTISPEEILQP